MSSIKRQYNTVVSQAKKGVTGFADAYAKFIEKATIEQSSKSLLANYSLSLAYIAIHINRPLHLVTAMALYKTKKNKHREKQTEENSPKYLLELFYTCPICNLTSLNAIPASIQSP